MQKQRPAGWISRSLAVARPGIFLLGLSCLSPACADIYSYTDNDGRVYLSNTPADKHYQVLVASPAEHHVATPLFAVRKPAPGLARKTRYNRIVEEVARTYGLDSALLHAVISVESRYNPRAVSKKGATGLMQLMPAIARHYGAVDLFDPVQNLHAGAKYLRDMLILFNSDVSLAVAAYNAGETAVVRYGNRIPPYRETMSYVPRVMSFYREYQSDRPFPARATAANDIDESGLALTPSRALALNLGGTGINALPLRKNL